jgi:hypothetical protein
LIHLAQYSMNKNREVAQHLCVYIWHRLIRINFKIWFSVILPYPSCNFSDPIAAPSIIQAFIFQLNTEVTGKTYEATNTSIFSVDNLPTIYLLTRKYMGYAALYSYVMNTDYTDKIRQLVELIVQKRVLYDRDT